MMTERAHGGDPEVSELNEQVKAALTQTRAIVGEIQATVIALEEFRQTKRARLGITDERQGP